MGSAVRDLPYDFTTLLENVLDVSHVPFTHHGTVSNRKNACPVDLQGACQQTQHRTPMAWSAGCTKRVAYSGCIEHPVPGACRVRVTQPPRPYGAVSDESILGFRGVWPLGPRNGYYGPQTTRFAPPNLMVHGLWCYDKRGFDTLTVVYAVPIAPGRCR